MVDRTQPTKRMTFEVNQDAHRKFHAKAILNGCTMQELLESYVSKYAESN